MADSRIAFAASSEVNDVISSIGRTEDIKLSPDNKRLAVVDFLGSRIFLFSIRIDRTFATPKITIFNYSIISSADLSYPHGITFLGNNHIVVCNRSANVCVFKIPLAGSESYVHNLKPRKSINGKGFLFARVKSPGSVDSYKIAANCYRILVCNNHWHFVTSHIINIRKSIQIRNNGVLIENTLKIPDGISCSVDGSWIAISNHVYGEVLIFKNTSELNRATSPTAILRGIVCPHGIRISPDGKRIFVADAASQYLHVFESNSGEWNGIHDPSRSIRLLDDESFYAGRYAAREGGIKGVDIDSSNTVLITTRMHDVMAFYDLSKLLAMPSNVDQNEMMELCRQRDQAIELHQNYILDRQWNLRTRAVHAIAQSNGILRYLGNARRLVTLCHLYVRNRWAKDTILNPSGPVLSLTTHDHRLKSVFFAIESIGRGSRKPSRIILWLEDDEAYLAPPKTLQRLKARGLEINLSEDLGPHTKYYPYIDRESDFHTPLVTADDDVVYPRVWLEKLIEAYETNPSVIHCHRAHRIPLSKTRIEPYNEWGPCVSRSPSHLNFVTGVCGAIYPPKFLIFLKQQGKAFERCCPLADDIWITANALRGGFKIAQVEDKYMPAHFPDIPGSQKQRLFDSNVVAGGNQFQLMQTFSESDLAELRAHLLSEKYESGVELELRSRACAELTD